MADDSKHDPVRTSLADVSQITLPTSSVPNSPSPEWESEAVALKDFSTKKAVPGFAKIVKGNYMTLGPSKFSFQRHHNDVFIHSVKVSVKILAHCLRKVENVPTPTKSTKSKRNSSARVSYSSSRLYSVDQRLAIPVSYQGWFELLSEDGKSARPITSVLELSKVRPDKVLVRENIKGYIQKEDGKMTFDSTKIVLAGEQLILCEDVALPSPAENKKVKLLRCFDSKGEQVYLSFDQKGLFTPIAGENDIAGVFTIRDVMRRFRLPLTVKLVQGVRPKVDPVRFTGLIRLDWAYSDETVFVCPIEKNHIRLLPVPVDTNLQLVAASNQEAMKSTQIYKNMWVKCNRMISNYNNTIHLIVTLPDAAAKGKNKPNANMLSGPIIAEPSRPTSRRALAKQEKIFDEIDDIYGYVRDGGTPPITSKMEYDSDEVSYFEEPAYEPLDDFRARLAALEAGEKVEYHSKYQPQDISKLGLEKDPEKIDDENPYGVLNGGRIKPFRIETSIPPALPARPLFDLSRTSSSTGSPSNSTNSPSQKETEGHPSDPKEASGSENPPPVPIRRPSQPEKFVTTVSASGVISSHRGSLPGQAGRGSVGAVAQHSGVQSSRAPINGRFSMGSIGSLDSAGSSGNRQGRLFGRDFRDSDISSITKQSSGSSSGHKKSSARKKLQTLYL